MKRSVQIGITTALLITICIIGFWLRMIPAKTNPQIGYSFDRAFHLRMMIDVLRVGSVPNVDRLSIYPVGKEITSQLPVFMYYLTAWFCKLLNLFGDVKASFASDYFSALSGALIAIPVFFISFSIYENMILALLAAVIAVLIPGHFRRTFCYWYKYEGIGTLFFCFSLQFFISAIKAKTIQKNILFSFLATLFLVLMFATWRLAILIFAIYFLYSTITLMMNKLNRDLEVALSFMVGGVLLASRSIEYLYANKFYSSRVFLLSIAVILTTYIVKYIYNNYLIDRKIMPVINTVLFGTILVTLFSFAAPTNYDNFNSLFFIRLAALFGKKISAEGINKVLLFTQELRPIKFGEMFGPEIYSYIVMLVGMYVIYLIVDFKNFFRKEILRVNIVFLVFFSVLFVSSMLFFRNKVLASPLLAIIAVGAVIYPIQSLYEIRHERRFIFGTILFVFFSSLFAQTCIDLLTFSFNEMSRYGSFAKAWDVIVEYKKYYWVTTQLAVCSLIAFGALGFIIYEWKLKDKSWQSSVKIFTSILTLAFTLTCAFKTSADVSMMACRTVNKFAPSPAVIKWIRDNASPNAVLMTYWGQGYTTQLYAGRPTLTDGFLENAEIRRRIMEMETAFYSQDEKDLHDICLKYHVSYIILPIFKTQAMAQTANVDYRLYENWQLRKPTPLGEKVNLFKMIYFPNRVRQFRLRFKTKMYRVYEVLY